ncbi:MAG: hypothetical protein KF690_07535 [Bacteroidetes bacterium]|nr:hypothetical protein [Bacteroidota bacterium]
MLSTIKLLVWAWCLVLAGGFYGNRLPAQTPMDGGDLAIYVSKKNLYIHPQWHSHLAAFVEMGDSLELSEENLKLAVTAQAGNFLAGQLGSMGVARAWNLSAYPDEARAFLRLHQPGQPLPHREAARLLPHTQWVLTVDSLRFDSELRRSFVVISNRIVEDSRAVRTVRLHIRLTQLTTGHQASHTVQWEAPATTQPLLFLPAVTQDRLVAAVLNWLTDQALLRLFMQITG